LSRFLNMVHAAQQIQAYIVTGRTTPLQWIMPANYRCAAGRSSICGVTETFVGRQRCRGRLQYHRAHLDPDGLPAPPALGALHRIGLQSSFMQISDDPFASLISPRPQRGRGAGGEGPASSHVLTTLATPCGSAAPRRLLREPQIQSPALRRAKSERRRPGRSSLHARAPCAVQVPPHVAHEMFVAIRDVPAKEL